jgi:hypothetical protein
VLKQVSKILDRYAEHSSETQQQPELKLMGKRLRAKVLFNGLRLLWFKAAKPEWSHWRLGAKARISDTYSKELDATTVMQIAAGGMHSACLTACVSHFFKKVSGCRRMHIMYATWEVVQGCIPSVPVF